MTTLDMGVWEGTESEYSVPVETELIVGTMLYATDRNRMRCLGEEEERGRRRWSWWR